MFRSKRDVDRHTQEIFRKLKNENERNLRCYNIAKLYHNVGDYATCCHYVSMYLSAKQDSAPARKLLGQAREALGKKDEALKEYKCSLELDGKQPDLILKVCELLADLDVHVDTGRARYWCERADQHFPHHPAVFKLKQKLLDDEGSGDSKKLESLIASEMVARPTDTNLRISLLRMYLKTNRLQDAYQHARDVEARVSFRDNVGWYDCLSDVFTAYEAANQGHLDWQFYTEFTNVLDRVASLSLDETSHRALQDCVQAVFRYDQALHRAASHAAPASDRPHYQEYLTHHQGQLCLHLATLVLKRAKKEPSTWRESARVAAPLLMGALAPPPDKSAAWLVRLPEPRKKVALLWVREAAYRRSQAGHVVLGLINETRTQFLERVGQFCATNWRERIYQRLFTAHHHHPAIETSHFVNAPALATPKLELPTANDLRPYDEESQELHPASLQHHTWLGLRSMNATAQRPSDVFHAQVFGGLQLACANLKAGGAETLDRLDCDAFLYATVLCADSAQRHHEPSEDHLSKDRPAVLPCAVTTPLRTTAQDEWWSAAWRVYTADYAGDLGKLRRTLAQGVEVVRALGNHGVDAQLLVRLARMFAERATILSSRTEFTDQVIAIEARAALYWSAALPLLEKMQRKQVIYPPETRLFDYQGKDLSSTELDMMLEEGKLFIALQLIKNGDFEQAIERLHPLRSPDATFHTAAIYSRLADAEVGSEPRESITSEMRSKHIIMLTKARDNLYLTVERLRSPTVDRKHPLNEVIGKHLTDIESKLNRIDPDVCRNEANRNLDNLSDESASSVRSAADRLNLAGLGNGGGVLPLTPRHPPHAAPGNNRYSSTPYRHSRTATEHYDTEHNRGDGRTNVDLVESQLRNLSLLVTGKDQVMETVAQQMRALLDSNQALHASVSALQVSMTAMLEDQRGMRAAVGDLGELKKQVQDLRAESTKRRGQADLADDLYVFDEEYPEDMGLSAAQLAAASQYPSFPPYADYSNLRQITGMLGTSTVTYGQPPAPAAPPMLPAEFFRNVDPALMYQQMGYYAHSALPFSEGQQLPDFRLPVYPPPPKAEVTPEVRGAAPVNVVITSSDVLPTGTPAQQPPLSVTIPPQHRHGVIPPPVQQQPPGLHAFQISMPSQQVVPNAEQLEKDSAALSPVIPMAIDTLLSTVPVPAYSAVGVADRSLTERDEDGSGEEEERDIYFKPVVPLPAEVEVTTGEEDEEVMFQNRSKLYRFMETEWKERGVGMIKLLRHPATSKIRLLMRREQVHKICANHLVTSDMKLTVMSPRALIWVANDFADETVRLEKLCAKFKTPEEAADFRAAFEKAAAMSPVEMSPKKPEKASKAAKSPIAAPKLFAETSPSKFVAGGFTFASTPKFKADVDTMTSVIDEVARSPEKPVEVIKPFAGFSFGGSTPGGKPATDWNMFGTPAAKDKPATALMFQSPHSDLSFTNIPVPDTGFKKDTSFQGFAGAGKPLFGGTPVASPGTKRPDDEEAIGGEDFIPTAEFAPVIPLPELVEVKTGEEGEITLFEDRAKLLRYNLETKEWKERGVGKFKILHDPTTGKVRFLMRREQVLKVCCNHMLTTKLEISKMKTNDKAYTWMAQDFSEGEVRPELFALRFKTADQALNFRDVVEGTQKAMNDDKLPAVERCAECAKNNADDPKCAACKSIKARIGASGDQAKPKPLSDLFKPKPGSWECGSCYTRNEATRGKCVSCEAANPSQPKPLSELFKAKAGSWECGSCYTRNEEDRTKCVSCKATNPAALKPLSELFKAKSGSWECKSCYTRNEPEKVSCVACEAAKPGHEKVQAKPAATTTPSFQFGIPASTKPVAAGVVPLSALFKPKPGSWECKDCYSRNEGDVLKCPSCSAPKPGTVVETTTVQKTSNTGSTLTFNPSPSSGSFNLGAPATTAAGLSFGVSAPKFSFGMPQASAASTMSFGFSSTAVSTAATTPKTDYGFGAIGTKPAVDNTTTTSLFGATAASKPFSFQPKAGGAFMFGAAAKTEATGLAFGTSAPIAIEQPRPATPPAEGTGAKLVFGSPGKEFNFLGVRPKSPGKSPRSPGRLLSTGEERETESEPEEDDGDHIYFTPVIPLPDKVPVCTGEENEEVLYCHRAKLFRYFEGEWKERGVGDFKILKHKTTSKIRLLMRREHILKLCLNHYLSPDIAFLPKDDKTWLWSAADFSEGAIHHEQFALRFKNPDIAADFKDALDAALVDLTSQGGDSSFNASSTYGTPAATPSTTTKKSATDGVEDVSPAMKAFSFSNYASTVKSQTPTSTSGTFSMAGLLGSGDKSTEVSRNLFGGSPKAATTKTPAATPGDVEVVYELHVTPEEEAAALRLQLPANFYAYRRKARCAGCRGCEPDSDDETADKSPILSGLLKTPSFVPPATLFATPAAVTGATLFGQPSFQTPATATPVFGMKPSTPMFGAKADDVASVFGVKPAAGTPLFGAKPVDVTPIFGAKSSESTSVFGGKTSESTPIFGMKPADATPVFGVKSAPIFGTPATVTPVFGVKAAATAAAPQSIFSKPQTTTVGFGTPGGRDANGLSTPAKEADEAAVPFLPCDSSVSFATLSDTAAKVGQPIETVTNAHFSWSGAGATLFGGASPRTPKPALLATPDSTTPATPYDEGEGEEGDDAEHDPQFAPIVPLPDAIEVRTGEEDEERVFCSRARLYRYQSATKEWKERGIGEMRILRHPVTGTYRLLLRREQVHKVVLNQLLTPDLVLSPLSSSDKAWCWGGYNYAEDEARLEELAVRFKLVETAQEFYDSVQRCIAEIQTQQDLAGEPSGVSATEAYPDEGGDEDYQDEEGEYGEDYTEEPIFEKRVTLLMQGEQHAKWATIGMGALQVNAAGYYADGEYNTITMLLDGSGNDPPQFISTLRPDTTIKRKAKSVLWSGTEYADDDETVEQCRTFIAKFSSETAALEFYQCIGEGILNDEEEDDSIPEV